jgi:hypothetical protein
MKERVERKVENAESVWLPSAHRMQCSHWLTDCGKCRAPIGSKNAGVQAPFGSQIERMQGSHWLKECGKCQAPIGTQNAEMQGFYWLTACGECKAPIGSQNAGICSCVYGAQTKSDDQTKYEKSLFFSHYC